MIRISIPMLLTGAILTGAVPPSASAGEGCCPSHPPERIPAAHGYFVHGPDHSSSHLDAFHGRDVRSVLDPHSAIPCPYEARRAALSPQQLDPQQVALQVEHGVERLFDEIRFGLRDRPATDPVLEAAWGLTRAARHLRASLQQQAESAHVQRDLQNVLAVCAVLRQQLQHQGSTWVIDRALARLDQQLTMLANEFGVAEDVAPQDEQSPEPSLQTQPVPMPPDSEPELLGIS